MSPERDDYLDDDGKDSRGGRPGPLAAGWLRALIVLGGLAIVLIIAVPYAIEWIAPSAPLPGPMTRPVPPPEPVKPEAVATAPAEPVKPEPTKAEPAAAPAPAPAAPAAQPAVAKAPAAAPRATAAAVKPTGTPTAATGGDYWIQVGLFASSDNAERLAKELRDERFAVEIAQTTRGDSSAPVSRHEVLVTDSTVEAVTAALKGTGTAEATTGGVVVRPAMDLKDAVTLSRRLAGEGLQVRIRRVATPTAGGTLYLVRVGGYPTRDAAATGKRELAAKGVTGFLTQGPVK